MTLHQNPAETLAAVEAELNYLAPTKERPRTYAYDPAPGVARTTAVQEPHTVSIRNARPIAAAISLDQYGFGLVAHRSEVRDFYDDDEVRQVYYPEAENLLKDVTGAARVFIFDHTVRRHVPGTEDRRDGLRQPATRVHVDHTARSGPQRVRDLLADEAQELLRGRLQVVNIWRPIRGPLLDAPLAVCDARSVDPDDLVPSDLIYRDRVGETYSVTYKPLASLVLFPGNACRRGAAAEMLRFRDRRSRALFSPHRLSRPDHAGGRAAAGKHRAQNAGFPSRLMERCDWSRVRSSHHCAARLPSAGRHR
jgi:hypothetical protein